MFSKLPSCARSPYRGLQKVRISKQQMVHLNHILCDSTGSLSVSLKAYCGRHCKDDSSLTSACLKEAKATLWVGDCCCCFSTSVSWHVGEGKDGASMTRRSSELIRNRAEEATNLHQNARQGAPILIVLIHSPYGETASTRRGGKTLSNAQ